MARYEMIRWTNEMEGGLMCSSDLSNSRGRRDETTKQANEMSICGGLMTRGKERDVGSREMGDNRDGWL